jgi:hypothetical protein
MPVKTTLMYLARDTAYQTEKPYATEFEIEEKDGVRRTNYRLVSEDVTVYEVQPGDDFTLDQNGFCVIEYATSLDVDQVISDPELVEDEYLQQLAEILTQRFPEYTRVEPFEFVVCVQHYPDAYRSAACMTWLRNPLGAQT